MRKRMVSFGRNADDVIEPVGRRNSFSLSRGALWHDRSHVVSPRAAEGISRSLPMVPRKQQARAMKCGGVEADGFLCPKA